MEGRLPHVIHRSGDIVHKTGDLPGIVGNQVEIIGRGVVVMLFVLAGAVRLIRRRNKQRTRKVRRTKTL